MSTPETTTGAAGDDIRRSTVPTDPAECRRHADDTSRPDGERIAWALTGILGQLIEIGRELNRRK